MTTSIKQITVSHDYHGPIITKGSSFSLWDVVRGMFVSDIPYERIGNIQEREAFSLRMDELEREPAKLIAHLSDSSDLNISVDRSSDKIKTYIQRLKVFKVCSFYVIPIAIALSIPAIVACPLPVFGAVIAVCIIAYIALKIATHLHAKQLATEVAIHLKNPDLAEADVVAQGKIDAYNAYLKPHFLDACRKGYIKQVGHFAKFFKKHSLSLELKAEAKLLLMSAISQNKLRMVTVSQSNLDRFCEKLLDGEDFRKLLRSYPFAAWFINPIEEDSYIIALKERMRNHQSSSQARQALAFALVHENGWLG